MPLPLDSPIVCQIPDCTTTQLEIELELKTYLSSYCTFCKQNRNGKLCGCAFPCSLTFRAQMLNKIHEILGIEKPPNRKHIQVCFKHPDLLKQAREACVAKRRELCTSARARKFDRQATLALTFSSSSNIAEQSDVDPRTEQETNENAVSVVRSDADNFEATIEQTKRGQVSFDESSVIRDSDSSDSELEQFEDFARRKFAEMARKYPVLEDKSSQMSKLIFNLQNESSSDDDFGDSESVQSLSCVHKAPEAKNNSPVSVRADLHRIEPEAACSSTRFNNVDSKELSGQKKSSKKLFRIHYQNYHQSVLMRQIRPLMHKSYLNDVQIVCRNGMVLSNSFLLGSMSPFLRDVLNDVPIVDKMKLIIVPDVNASDVETFLGLVFSDQEQIQTVNEKDAKSIRSLALVFMIDAISVTPKRPGRPRGSTNKRKLPKSQTRNESKDIQDVTVEHSYPCAENLDQISSSNFESVSNHELPMKRTRTLFDPTNDLSSISDERISCAQRFEPQRLGSFPTAFPRDREQQNFDSRTDLSPGHTNDSIL